MNTANAFKCLKDRETAGTQIDYPLDRPEIKRTALQIAVLDILEKGDFQGILKANFSNLMGEARELEGCIRRDPSASFSNISFLQSVEFDWRGAPLSLAFTIPRRSANPWLESLIPPVPAAITTDDTMQLQQPPVAIEMSSSITTVDISHVRTLHDLYRYAPLIRFMVGMTFRHMWLVARLESGGRRQVARMESRRSATIEPPHNHMEYLRFDVLGVTITTKLWNHGDRIEYGAIIHRIGEHEDDSEYVSPVPPGRHYMRFETLEDAKAVHAFVMSETLLHH